jgi:hypothetical protein
VGHNLAMFFYCARCYFAAGCDLKELLFSKIGAVGLGANTVLEGRMLSKER